MSAVRHGDDFVLAGTPMQQKKEDPNTNVQTVDRYTSHVIFLMRFAQFISCISHCMAQDEPPYVSV